MCLSSRAPIKNEIKYECDIKTINIIIPVIITPIMTIIFGFIVKKLIKYWRQCKGRCIGCGTKSKNWSIYGVKEGYHRCDDCGKVQLKCRKKKGEK